jgi:hypothetical protein
MTSDRRLGWLAILAGAVLALAVQVAAPVGVPLYDGVVVQEPYRYLHPSGDQAGSPGSFSSTPTVSGGIAPNVIAFTNEAPPQAQLIAQEGAFVLTPSATGLQVAITPIEAPAPPPGGVVAGNVYRFSVTDQAGTPLAIKDCEGCITLLLRAPEGVGGSIQRFADGAWISLETNHAGTAALYQTDPTVLGDFAVIAIEEPAEGIDPLILAGGAALLILLGAGAFLLLRVRQAPVGPPGPRGGAASSGGTQGRPPSRIPSKRKPRTPSSGRSAQ